MKIYTRIVCAWQPDGSLKRIEADSFDYAGPLTLSKDAPEPPPPPDYAGAAKTTAESARTNQYTPYGNQIWSPGQSAQKAQPIYGEDGRQTGMTQAVEATPWSSTISLNPEAQKALDTQMQSSTAMGQLALSQMPRVQDQYSRGMDLSSVQGVADKAYGAMTSRLDPQWQHGEEMQKTQLANQGLVPGGEAYNNSMRVFNQGKNDAYQQANLGAISTMPQTYSLAQQQYNQPLNTLNAIRTGSQVQNPQFASQGPGANMLGAAQAQGTYEQGLYGSQVGEANAGNSNTMAAAAAVAAMI